MRYWRTLHGSAEVDCIIGNELAIEIKATQNVTPQMLSSLKALKEEKMIGKYLVVSRDAVQRTIDGITILPWQDFLEKLWSGNLLR
jgi:predicted AAA+ superfamily ATPase